jgi:outer membrane protein assembly factor BamB
MRQRGMNISTREECPVRRNAVETASQLTLKRVHSPVHVLLCGLLFALSACGGGGGSGSSSTSGNTAQMFVASSFSESATAADPAPVDSLPVNINYTGNAQGPVYAKVSTTNSGVNSFTIGNDVSIVIINIAFKAPSSLAVGIYHDTMNINICYDAACNSPVIGSPQTVALTYTVNPAKPVIDSLLPGSVPAGSPAFTLNIAAEFVDPSSVVLWNGSPRTTAVVPGSGYNAQITAQITAADLADVGMPEVTITNAASGGPVSDPQRFNVQAPAVAAILPSSIVAGAPSFTMNVALNGAVPQSTVLWNGSPRPTTFVSSTEITAQIAATDVESAGNATVSVANGGGSGATTSGTTFSITSLGSLALAAVSPKTVSTGGPAFRLTVLGSGFTSNSVVQWNGSPRSTTYVSDTELTAQITSADIAVVATATVLVSNAASQGGNSAPATVAITPRSIDAVAFQITPAHAGYITFKNVSLPPSTPAWSTDVGGAPSYALIASGKVFVTVALSSGGSALVALNQSTGAVAWGPVMLSGDATAAYDSGMIFALTTTNGNGAVVQSFNAATGQSNWSTTINSQRIFDSGITAYDGNVFAVGTGNGGTVYALDQNSGAITWSQNVIGGDGADPALTADSLYVAYPCWAYSIRPATGEVIWSYTTGCGGGGGATPVYANGVIYAPIGALSYDGSTFNSTTGALLGSYSADVPMAVDATTGYFLKAATLTAVPLTSGSTAWSFVGDGKLVTSPIVVNQYVFIGSSSGNVYALDSGSGAPIWQYNVGAAIPAGDDWNSKLPLSGLAAGDGLFVVPGGTKVTAFVLSSNP